MEANNIQEKVNALKRHVSRWSNFRLSKRRRILAKVGVNGFHDGT
jgi:hypothetical protein